MTKEDLVIGMVYTGGGGACKLMDFGENWLLVIHYDTSNYVADAEFFRLNKFLEEFHQSNEDWDEEFNDLVFGDWRHLSKKYKD